jgi:hypothetical protein
MQVVAVAVSREAVKNWNDNPEFSGFHPYYRHPDRHGWES